MNRIHGHHISPPVTFLGNNSIGKLCQEPFRVEKSFLWGLPGYPGFYEGYKKWKRLMASLKNVYILVLLPKKAKAFGLAFIIALLYGLQPGLVVS